MLFSHFSGISGNIAATKYRLLPPKYVLIISHLSSLAAIAADNFQKNIHVREHIMADSYAKVSSVRDGIEAERNLQGFFMIKLPHPL